MGDDKPQKVFVSEKTGTGRTKTVIGLGSSAPLPHAEWRLPWLASPSFLSGVASVADVFGTVTWYAPFRLTEAGSLRELRRDFDVIARDLRNALYHEVEAARADQQQQRLFDPGELDSTS